MEMMNGSSLLAPTSYRLEGKVAVITGGASGVGASTARLYVRHGAKVVVADIQDDLGRSLCESIGSEEVICFIHCDVTSNSDVQNAVNTAVAKYGKLDIMFSNAGIGGNPEPSLVAADSEDLKRVFDVNVVGGFLCAKHAARVMIPSKKGSILFTSSIASVTAGLAPHAYVVSKHAVVGLAKNLGVELGQFGIRVNCISPYAMFTPLCGPLIGIWEKQKLEEAASEAANMKETVLEVEDVAEAAVYLGSDESKYVSGLNLLLDGGYSTTNQALAQAMRRCLSN